MELSAILSNACILYAGQFVASFPFGFVLGYRKSVGKPFSDAAVSKLGKAEFLTEACITIILTAVLTSGYETHALAAVTASYAVLLLFEIFVCQMFMQYSAARLVTRIVFSLFVCLPLGVATKMWLSGS